jgi:hypothetical protein
MEIIPFGSPSVRLRWFATAIVCTAVLIPPLHSVRAQNLISDPYFTNGVPADGPAPDGTVTSYGATAATLNGMTGINLNGSSGYFQIFPLSGYDTNGVNYVFTLLAASLDTNQTTYLSVQFGYTTGNSNCGDCIRSSIDPILTSAGLTQYTLTGTSSASNGSAGFISIEADGGAGAFVTGLDFEAAPAPVPGAGILSICVLFAGLAFRRRSARRAG